MADLLALVGVSSADSESLGILLPAFKVVEQMADTYANIKLGRKRCKLVIHQAGLIIKALHSNPRNDWLTGPNITKLQKKFDEIQTIMQKLADMSLFKALLRFEDINREIESATHHLTECLQMFPNHLSIHIDAQRKAAMSDRDALRDLLKILAGNYEEIRRHFGLYNDEQEDQAVAAMEREIRNTRITSVEEMPMEVQIMQKSLECIKASTGRSTPKQNKWLITEYDLDYCGTIGRGGFSTVRKARFRGTMVAVKTLKDIGNTREALEREIEIWSGLRHDHIVPFYGASTLTSPSYIVSRYMQNGNLVQYLVRTPRVDRTKLLFEISLGMYYLHEEFIVHGDLKSLNVLVDDAGKACITDFGLSKVCASGAAGTGTGRIAGTLRFLAPEALKGQPLNFETDVYAFGMVIYEVFTGEVPFILESDNLIFEGRVELQRPTSGEVYMRGFDDTLWELLSKCISREPAARPRFRAIQEQLCSIKNVQPSVQSTPLNTTLGTRVDSLTNWGIDTNPVTSTSATLMNSVALLHEKGRSSSGEQPDILPGRPTPCDIKSFPPVYPMCIIVTHKYFDGKFSVLSRELGVHVEEANTSRWQPIMAGKRSLLYEEGNKFRYKSNIGEGNSAWELDGNDVILRTAFVNPGICHFNDERTAQRWFGLQLGYARDGSIGGWSMAMGDLFYTEKSWRRLMRGKIQQADLITKSPVSVPTGNSWRDISLPKRCIIDGHASTENCIVCITDPGGYPGRLCCKLKGCQITIETYRHQSDERPRCVREETYPSEECAGVTFHVLYTTLRQAGEKSTTKSFFLPF